MKKAKKKPEKKEKKKEEKKGKTSASPICTLKCIYKRLSYKWTEGQTNQWIDAHSSIDPTSGIKRTSTSLISAPKHIYKRLSHSEKISIIRLFGASKNQPRLKLQYKRPMISMEVKQ